MSLELTPWMPSSAKPVREGVYQRLLPDGEVVYARWSSLGGWHAFKPATSLAAREDASTNFPGLPWRGMTLVSHAIALVELIFEDVL